MGKFIEYPQVRKTHEPQYGRARWELMTRLIYWDRNGRTWVVPAGYITDFASVPRLPLAYWLTGDHAHMAAVLHDYLCTDYYPTRMTWREAADLFNEAMQAEGVSRTRRWAMYWAVRLFGEAKKEEE